MPNRTKKDNKRNNQSGGSHWQNFHFSGKLIVCSVIFGLMLILIGGIVMAIGNDRDEDTKSDDYEDIQKKPPMAIVGPVIMGIGGFTVFVGVFMCLVETNVCRRRNVENSPLIEDEDRSKDSAATGIESDPTAIPSTSHKHRNGNHRKSPSPRKSKISTKKPYSTDRNHDAASSRSPSSAPITIAGQSSKSYLSASDKFLTPPSSFANEMHSNSRDAENQTSSSLMKSFTSSGNSWTVSTEFQTPNASSIENSMSLESSPMKERLAGMLDPNSSIINSHEFLTPKNSNAKMMISMLQNPDNPTKLISEIPISAVISGSNVSVANDKSEIKQEVKGQPISFSEVLVTASVGKEAELENQDNEYHLSDSSEKDVEGALRINESGESNKSQIEASADMPISSEIIESKEKDTEPCEEAPLNPVAEKDLKDDNLVKKVLDQRDDNIETSNTCIDEDKSKSCNTEEVVSKEPEHIISVAEEGSQSNGVNTNQETDISQQKNISPKENVESEQKIMESESVNEITDSARKSSLNTGET